MVMVRGVGLIIPVIGIWYVSGAIVGDLCVCVRVL